MSYGPWPLSVTLIVKCAIPLSSWSCENCCQVSSKSFQQFKSHRVDTQLLEDGRTDRWTGIGVITLYVLFSGKIANAECMAVLVDVQNKYL